MTEFPKIITTYQSRINYFLEKVLPAAEFGSDLPQAMRYAVLSGGKRLRALLIYAIGEAFQAKYTHLDVAAGAVECVHAYSLIHDDLPAMDNDDLRHGQPACHKAFGEAIAILAGDALQTFAFELLSSTHFDLQDSKRIRIMQVLANAIGSRGMAGGQALDLAAEGQTIAVSELERIHRLKTGALIQASISIGFLLGNNGEEKILHLLHKFGYHLGIAFQIQDDILDLVSTSEVLGKPQGSDVSKNKSTYPALLGLDGAKSQMVAHYQSAKMCLAKLGLNSALLDALISFLEQRNH